MARGPPISQENDHSYQRHHPFSQENDHICQRRPHLSEGKDRNYQRQMESQVSAALSSRAVARHQATSQPSSSVGTAKNEELAKLEDEMRVALNTLTEKMRTLDSPHKRALLPLGFSGLNCM
jgi:hypothetical protein